MTCTVCCRTKELPLGLWFAVLEMIGGVVMHMGNMGSSMEVLYACHGGGKSSYLDRNGLVT